MTSSSTGSTAVGTEREAGGPGRRPGFRKDIEGLRALAVGLVVCGHLIGYPTGGFVGVDVFFVISGFLITGLLVRERERSGVISFAGFYRRRARRILPIAALVLVVTVVGSYLVFLGSRGHDTLNDAVWSAVFAANVHFAQIGTDYFQTALPPSPVQHFWSLAVEEQFYLAWPWILIAAFGLGARRTGRHRVHLVGFLSVIVIGSLAWCLVETSVSPTSAYFSTFARGWELGAGALVAVGSSAAQRLPDRARPLLASVGLATILVSAVLIGPGSAFPGPWAVLPVAGTVAVIIAGTGKSTPFRWWWPLTDPVSQFVGRISYSVYLWHWPVIVVFFAGVVPPGVTRSGKLANAVLASALTLGLATLSFHLVEDPVRRSSWLEPRSVRREARASRRRPSLRGAWSGRSMLAGSAATAVIASLVVVIGVLGSTSVRLASPGRAAHATAAPSDAASTAGPDDGRTALIRTGLGLDHWPQTSPPLGLLAGSGAPILRNESCVNGRSDVDRQCVEGDVNAPRRAVLFGDSIAMSWLPGVEAALEPRGYRVTVYGKYGCGFASVTQTDKDGRPYDSCDAHNTWVLAQIAADTPDLVIVSESWGVTASGAGPGTAQDRWLAGVRATLDRLVATGTRVVVLGSPPFGVSIEECATRFRTPRDCAIPVPSAMKQRSALYRETAGSAGAQFVDTEVWFCSSGWCPPTIGDFLVRSDSIHLTEQYSRDLGVPLARVLLGS
ncbi:MAG TPA: acyltransferase family protein [Cellulomonadaceae bacterium]|nr:acyltransferase family protein [Cellulomonadaceae bacterium]